MVPLLYGFAAALILWGTITLGDRVIRARMLSRLRRGSCPKCNAIIATSRLRESGRITETFGERPGLRPYGSKTFVELYCDSCGRTSVVTLRGDDVSVMFENDNSVLAVGFHA